MCFFYIVDSVSVVVTSSSWEGVLIDLMDKLLVKRGFLKKIRELLLCSRRHNSQFAFASFGKLRLFYVSQAKNSKKNEKKSKKKQEKKHKKKQ